MADTGLRYATQPISLPTQTISKGEVRASSDAAVITTPASFWATIDTADTRHPERQVRVGSDPWLSSDEITDTMVEAGAEELYHEASRGQPWPSADHDVQHHFRGVVRRIMERGQTAELARQSQRHPR
jgi:hypothetical protein